jgi:hypothetical protein
MAEEGVTQPQAPAPRPEAIAASLPVANSATEGDPHPPLAPPPDGWVIVSIPAEVKMLPEDIAARSGWILRARDDGRWNACLRESYEHRAPRLLVLEPVVDAATAGNRAAYDKLRAWSGQDRFLDPKTIELGRARLQELARSRTRVAAWEAFGLRNLISGDAELAAVLRDTYPALAEQLSQSSLWMITVNPWYHSRKALTRVLFGAEEVPELLTRPEEKSVGIEAGRNLESWDEFGFGSPVQIALLAAAPGVLGIVNSRLPGMVVLLFGHFESGSDSTPSELMSLFRPRLLSEPIVTPQKMPEVTSRETVSYLRWWVDRLDLLLGIALNPTLFQTRQQTYEPQSHFGFLLSLDRLFATIKGLLVASRRDEFVRSLLLFQAIDLFKGFGFGPYEKLLAPDHIEKEVNELERELPEEVAKILLPRCKRAVAGIKKVKDGFYLTERINADGLQVKTKAGQLTRIGLDRATGEYVNLIRDAGHTLREKMVSPRDISLFAAHDGSIEAEVADVAFVYLVRLFQSPDRLAQILRSIRY